ncbi:multidrug resistance-associated ABC transporter [Cylindrobasidium torrendii FP15055 ss-10]|uniref:Multidrug resistance-associated ABC transporter n=1 Tax=Cylindrobasidium torrendii FP15055 ss-10 TaxID=1314674 RepID=A0A0D7B5G3_9AGAR|nr:multidrug resistance-associated ABC transporter [Cylindrobasidium torrendii FP15055 ss-10]
MWNPLRPSPAPPGFGGNTALPEHRASWLSRITFAWLTPLLNVGYSRPLEVDDLWQLPDGYLVDTLATELETRFYARCPPEERPAFIQHKFPQAEAPSTETESGDEKTPSKPPVYDKSLHAAAYQTFRRQFWLSGIFQLVGDSLKTTSPLVLQVFLEWLAATYVWHNTSEEQRQAIGLSEPQGVGYGIGVGIGVFAMAVGSNLFGSHASHLAMAMGLRARSAVIGSIFRKSLRLSGRARQEHSSGQIMTMVSTDATRLDEFTTQVHHLWVSPIQIVVGIALLIKTLGYSALVGVGVLVISIPAQGILLFSFYSLRKSIVLITDKRVRLSTEILQGIRLLKFYAWEPFFGHRVTALRQKEIAKLKGVAWAISTFVAVTNLVPLMAIILSFVTYSLTGHQLTVSTIFTAMRFFDIIRAPLSLFPFAAAALADTLVAGGRISTFLTAEELDGTYLIEQGAEDAVKVDGSFTWERTAGSAEKDDKAKDGADKDNDDKKSDSKKTPGGPILPTTSGDTDDTGNKEKDAASEHAADDDEKPFELQDLHLRIRKGAFVAIVGRVGSGKSSILQALIGEMRRTEGSTVFGGSVAYVAQTPWIRNATLRDNVLFGRADDEERFRRVVRACALEHDLEMLPNGEKTEIGEKGINLSGGQKARVALARAAYSASDIVLLDDPLAAVDSYVGKDILDNCILDGPLSDRTRILVTHAMHVLDKTDYIYVVDEGKISEQGTYAELRSKQNGAFAELLAEHGPTEKAVQRRAEQAVTAEREKETETPDALMQDEERLTGAVGWSTYKEYLDFAGGILLIPVFLVLLVASEGATVASSIFLGYWTGRTIDGFTDGQYMGVYAGIGGAQALLSFLLNFAFSLVSLVASLRIFRHSLSHVLMSPVSFFDTTPMGRVLARFSKDQDTLDSQLAVTLYAFTVTLWSVFGAVFLVFWTFPYLGIIFAPMVVIYYFVQTYYRRTSVETKRLDSILRSVMYSKYAETMTGLATIRAYQGQDDAVKSAERGLDLENRAYYMTIAIQWWLSVRLDIFANVLVLGITLFAAGFARTVNPSKIAPVLTYTLSVTQMLTLAVSQFAQNEQNMNAVERVLAYTQLPAEGRPEKETTIPSREWPQGGEIVFTDVTMAYRPGLPAVLKNVSFAVRPGEKVGIVGRTGAGKSSLLQALFRIVELDDGKVELDGLDISTIALETLRGRLALVPQETSLFLGTLRDNLDPQGIRSDAELLSVLQRAGLLPQEASKDGSVEAKFNLGATVGDDGSNFSVGEKQLLSLARALVKNSRIIVLDEATSSVDVETDARIQRTIQTEFVGSTLVCIAHRLHTIAYYDRILVMDGGRVAEFDTVLNLFDTEDSIFRSLCNEADLSRADILRIRQDAKQA